MGWDICEAHREATPMLYFERHVQPHLNCKILAAKAVGTTVYAVCDDGYALVCLTTGNCGYKLIDEECGPAEDHCPKALLEMLRWPAPSDYAEQWRNRCAAHFKQPVKWNKPCNQ